MADYYDELDQPHVPEWRRVGWRRRIEQAYRFEAVLEVIRCSVGQVVDVGCGLGELSEYAAARGVQRSWLGIESRPAFARAARLRHPVIESRFEDVVADGGCSVAIGTLAGSASRVGDLLGFLDRSAPVSCLVVLDEDGLNLRPALSMEHRANAVSALRLAESGGDVVRLSPTDLMRVRGVSPDELRSVEARFVALIAAAPGIQEPPDEKAWLACELELVEHAQIWLERSGETALAEVVSERLGALDRPRSLS